MPSRRTALRPPRPWSAGAAAGALGAVSILSGGGAREHPVADAGTPPSEPPAALPEPLTAIATLADRGTQRDRALPLPPGVHLSLQVKRDRAVRVDATPDGRALASIGSRTEFGSARTLPVVARRRAWLKVLADASGRASGWVRWSRRSFRLTPQRWQIVVDRSRGRLAAVADGHVVKRLPVGVGRPGSPTPVGRFAVTDKLSGRPYGGAYGCCVLALSGHQRRLPAGWGGGDRLAIHATAPGRDRRAGSAGCVIGSDAEVRWLARRVPVGTIVSVRP